MNKKIFRDVSLERLSSPEQLDQLITVTSLRAWLVLIAIGLILVSVLVWSFWGSIPTKVDGQGILLNNGEVFSLSHQVSGQVLDIGYEPGDTIKKGDVVARIDRPELVDKINDLQRTQQELEKGQKTGGADYQLLTAQIKRLQETLIYDSQIVSPVQGRILELNMTEGSMVQQGNPLAVIEQSGPTVRLEAVIYVPAGLGEEIRPGMEAQVSPAMVNKEEYGFMLGRVVSVAEYPATTQSMMQTLGNENLIALLTGQGAPLKVQIDLIPDKNTVSGYKWSSPEGPPLVIPSGTLIQCSVVVAREKPIGKVVPILK